MITRCTMTREICGRCWSKRVSCQSNLKLRYHKFRLNLFASARKEIP